jgi:hypothetical protein
MFQIDKFEKRVRQCNLLKMGKFEKEFELDSSNHQSSSSESEIIGLLGVLWLGGFLADLGVANMSELVPISYEV